MNVDIKNQNSVTFCLSKDLKIPFKFRVISIDGDTDALSNTELVDQSPVSTLLKSKAEQQPLKEVFSMAEIVSAEKQLIVPVVTPLQYMSSETGAKAAGLSVSPGVTASSGVANKRGQPQKGKSNSWVTLPINYSQLPLDSVLRIVLFKYHKKTGAKVVVGLSELQLFNLQGGKDDDPVCTLKKGHQKLKLKLSPKYRSSVSASSEPETVSSKMDQLEKTLKSHESGDIVSVDWLDQLSFRKIEQINFQQMSSRKRTVISSKTDPECYIHLALVQFDMPVVYLDYKYSVLSIPTFDPHALGLSAYGANHSASGADENMGSLVSANGTNDIMASNIESSTMNVNVAVFDPDQYRDNINEDPIEIKFRKLERIHQSSPLDKDIKPTLKVRSQISSILRKQFFEKLSPQEKNLIWKFRYFLLNNLFLNKNTMDFNNFIINFIKCVDWDDDFEVKEFLTIINEMEVQHLGDGARLGIVERRPDVFVGKLEVVDCLELLSANYRNHIVRKMAIERLGSVSDDELEMYLVQLVQCIKNEANYVTPTADNDDVQGLDEDNFEFGSTSGVGSTTTNASSSDYQFVEIGQTEDPALKMLEDPKIFSRDHQQSLLRQLPKLQSPLAKFVISRASKNVRLMNFFYWHLKVEVDDETEELSTRLPARLPLDENEVAIDNNIIDDYLNGDRNTYVRTAGDRPLNGSRNEHHRIFRKTQLHFILHLAMSEEGSEKILILRKQIDVIGKLHEIALKIKFDFKKEPTPKKVELLKGLLVEKQKKRTTKRKLSVASGQNSNFSLGKGEDNSHHSHFSLLEFDAVPLPLDPSVVIGGCIPAQSSVFKSSLSPLKITFKSLDDQKYPVMYKIGDDLRQDQFVVQIITLMEKILQNENLDLKLKPYKILALGPVEGMIQFIPNESLSSILAKYNNSILTFLQQNNPDLTSPLRVRPEIMDNYVRSCAGYCVVTYILGVGDRHLENLLLTKDGYFFHADFGYILGQDPKPFPPLMKLPIQIIEGMGGLGDENYKKFCNYCFITYITLRRNSSLILNLFQLMIDSSIPVLKTSASLDGSFRKDISNETEKLELILKIQEKFMLELNDEEAILHFQNLINDSVNAFLPVVIDRLHSLAQYWRS
ncbi:unnamed protein product [Kuraishia capsulata CBS 1993]|uniref:Phosphatidylinositol 3-kinase VPS34 n=1 Tax=Kuraishia capsulata CBS 1993 TaxID=1382522 RepID=W6MG39_9ASCO|nr:uncharacterized protein KUCA_T00000926001 [Kuraishia capsulata CBS 1993]CDK24959.1 unnamed protein product [Kuraishia capsulata CBS 1993]